jgi:hypothetical protein
MQLLAPDALVCDMCGFDTREFQPVTAGGPTASAAEERLEPKH